jgi:hypothetical protein
MHRQAKLADKRPIGLLIGAETPAKMLDIDRTCLLACHDSSW